MSSQTEGIVNSPSNRAEKIFVLWSFFFSISLRLQQWWWLSDFISLYFFLAAVFVIATAATSFFLLLVPIWNQICDGTFNRHRHEMNSSWEYARCAPSESHTFANMSLRKGKVSRQLAFIWVSTLATTLRFVCLANLVQHSPSHNGRKKKMNYSPMQESNMGDVVESIEKKVLPLRNSNGSGSGLLSTLFSTDQIWRHLEFYYRWRDCVRRQWFFTGVTDSFIGYSLNIGNVICRWCCMHG